MSKPLLTNDDFCRAAKRIRCEVAAIKAVADTESRGNGFYADGFPVILYERHIFRKYTDGKFNKSHPELSGSQGNYGKPGANQRRKFSAAFELDPIAAMKACSWGKFQLMGFNWKVCGFSSVEAMIDAMKESEGKHLEGFVSFVKGNRLDDEIRERDWAGFAYGYNGAGYRINKYDVKMAAAYKKFAKENIDCSKTQPSPVVQPAVSATTPPDTTHTDNSNTDDTASNLPTQEQPAITQNADTIINQNPQSDGLMDKANALGDKATAVTGVLDKFGVSIADAKTSMGTVLLTGFKVVLALGSAAWGAVSNHPEYLIFAIALIGLAAYLWDRSRKRVADAKAGLPIEMVQQIVDKK